VSYKTEYFPFVLIGIAFSTYITTSLQTFSANIRQAQTTGVLESMLITPSSIVEIIAGMSVWDFAFASIRIFVYLLFGMAFFGLRFSSPNIPAAILILALTIACFSFIGIMSAGFILIFKRGEPIGWFMGSIAGLFGGVYFPVEVLNSKLQVISNILPVTYALRSLRHAILAGASFRSLMPDILALAGFCIALLPLAVFIFKCALRRVKTDGSLVHY